MEKERRIKALEATVSDIQRRVDDLEKENALMMRALAKLTEEKTQEVKDDRSSDCWIPGTIPETGDN